MSNRLTGGGLVARQGSQYTFTDWAGLLNKEQTAGSSGLVGEENGEGKGKRGEESFKIPIRSRVLPVL